MSESVYAGPQRQSGTDQLECPSTAHYRKHGQYGPGNQQTWQGRQLLRNADPALDSTQLFLNVTDFPAQLLALAVATLQEHRAPLLETGKTSVHEPFLIPPLRPSLSFFNSPRVSASIGGLRRS